MNPDTNEAELYLGLMSGTSLDGVDAALVDCSGALPRLLQTSYLPYPDQLRHELLALNHVQPDELERAARAAQTLAALYAEACAPLLAGRSVRAIGCHGQTIRHRPDLGYTIQIGNAARLAELTDTPVVADFRSRDIAAGGQGAPLVPAFHAEIFAHPTAHRVIANIGGIANITDVAPCLPIRGWDTGPGNLLLDGWAARHLGQPYDADGAWAAQGSVQPGLLAALLEHEFFRRPLPKSAGREEFNQEALTATLSAFPGLAPVDVQATLAEFTATTLATDIRAHCPGTDAVYVCGGGAHNSDLQRRLSALLPSATVESTAALGVDPDWVEAMAFAWLARQAIHGLPGNLAAVTGASGPRILGAIYPA